MVPPLLRTMSACRVTHRPHWCHSALWRSGLQCHHPGVNTGRQAASLHPHLQEIFYLFSGERTHGAGRQHGCLKRSLCQESRSLRSAASSFPAPELTRVQRQKGRHSSSRPSDGEAGAQWCGFSRPGMKSRLHWRPCLADSGQDAWEACTGLGTAFLISTLMWPTKSVFPAGVGILTMRWQLLAMVHA